MTTALAQMVWGPTEILTCIVPVFVIIAVIGVLLVLNNRRSKD